MCVCVQCVFPGNLINAFYSETMTKRQGFAAEINLGAVSNQSALMIIKIKNSMLFF